MRYAFVLAALLFTQVVSAQTGTLRLDYYHTGDAKSEVFSLDRVVVEPLPWPGDLAQAIDPTNLGKYFFEVVDLSTQQVLFSRGFASIYGEWELTDEAARIHRTFHESLRFPDFKRPVQVRLKKRGAENAFVEIWTTNIDPDDIFMARAVPGPAGKLLTIFKNGEPADKLDFLLLGDGYTAAECTKFERDARRLTDTLFATSPFKERKKDFNVWAICPPAEQSGISRPSEGIYRASPLGTSYDTFGSERYILTYDNRQWREVAAHAPYEFVEMITNTRTYGGGGIFGLYGTVSADNDQSPYVFIHELGHHLAGLADEYYTSPVAYQPTTERPEPWEPNATALHDPENLKWKSFVEPGTPLPTPWQKETYERQNREYGRLRAEIRSSGRPEAEMEALFRSLREQEERLFREEKYAGRVGAFEGANYEATGYYRPEVNCIMFTRSPHFCKVCAHALERVINLYSKP